MQPEPVRAWSALVNSGSSVVFLRYQEIASRLPAAREGVEALRAYPLFKSWLPPDTHVDLFTGDRWQRVKLVGVQDDQITYLERSGIANRSISTAGTTSHRPATSATTVAARNGYAARQLPAGTTGPCH
jgi:hypothetical protein